MSRSHGTSTRYWDFSVQYLESVQLVPVLGPTEEQRMGRGYRGTLGQSLGFRPVLGDAEYAARGCPGSAWRQCGLSHGRHGRCLASALSVFSF